MYGVAGVSVACPPDAQWAFCEIALVDGNGKLMYTHPDFPDVERLNSYEELIDKLQKLASTGRIE